MAYTTSSDSIIIRATLTKKGKKLLARGKFKVAKFALGDDEVDYRLYNATVAAEKSDYKPALKNTKIIEALKDTDKNIQFGLDSYDGGILYLTRDQITELGSRKPHAFIEYLPILVKNTKTTYAPTLRDNKYYVSVNDETTRLLIDNVPSFNFLEANDYEKIKIVVESGIHTGHPVRSPGPASIQNRDILLVKKFLLDHDFIVNADNRLIKSIVGIQQESQFENYANSTEKVVNFSTALNESPAVSLHNMHDYHASFLLKGIPNLVQRFLGTADSGTGGDDISNLKGPRGTVVAFNVVVDNKLKINSTGVRDSRFSDFGTLNTAIFNEIPTRKFDYIDTTIYIVGATSNSGLQIPLRIVRYAGI